MRALRAQVRVELTMAARRGEGLLVSLGVPVALLVFFAAVLPIAATGERPVDFLVPGILALAIMSSSMVSLGIATAFERYYGVLKRLVGSPLPRSTLLAAKTLATLAVQLLQVAVVATVAAVFFGWRPGGSVPLALLALLVGSVTFAGIGLFMAGTLRAEGTLAAANGLYLLLLLLGGFVYPVESLPAPLAAAAGALPAAALSHATRSALGSSPTEALPALALLAGWAVLAGGAAAVTFRAD